MPRYAALAVSSILLLFGACQLTVGQSAGNGQVQGRFVTANNSQMQSKDIAMRIQHAKLLYKEGKLDDSEEILVQVLRDDPSNHVAPYYLDLIKEARYSNYISAPESFRAGPAIPSLHVTACPPSRASIFSKLVLIRLGAVKYDLPLTAVLNDLRIESRKQDEGNGINFMIDPRPITAVENVPVDAVPVPVSAVDMARINIKTAPAAANISLVEVLDAVVAGADRPIEYRIEDYAVIFSPKAVDGPLYIKAFKVNGKFFEENLRELYGKGPARAADPYLSRMLARYLADVGLNLSDREKSVFWEPRQQLVVVRGAARDLQIAESAIFAINRSPSRK
jgi:hypothetical protein